MNKNFALSVLVFVVFAPIVFGVTQSFFDLWTNGSWVTFELSVKLGIIMAYVFGFPLAVFLAWLNARLSHHWFLKMAAASFGCGILWYALLSHQQVWDLINGRSAGWGDLVAWGCVVALATTTASLVCAAVVRAILKWRPW